MRGCYLICFSKPYRHARHYLGWAGDIKKRVQLHEDGAGARLMQVIKQAGIEWSVVRTWPDTDRAFEKRLKGRHGSMGLCPHCKKSLHKEKNMSANPITDAQLIEAGHAILKRKEGYMKDEETVRRMLVIALREYDEWVEQHSTPAPYADGVRTTLEWILGEGDPPYED